MAEDQQSSEGSSNAQSSTLGVGTYRAVRVDNDVVLFARGDTPTPNYRVWLQPAGEQGSALHELCWLAPLGDQAQVLTPFFVHASIRLPVKEETLEVRDADGVHEIPIEAPGALATKTTDTLVPVHWANQFNLRYADQSISFTQANVAGDPLLSIGERVFFGDEVCVQKTAIGELVTVTILSAADGDRRRFSLLLPPTRMEGHETVDIEAVVIETLVRSTIAGSRPGPGVVYDKATTLEGEATYIIS